MNRILEELAILTLGQVDPSQVRRALQRARMDACVDGGPAVLALWERASREVGLRLEAVRGSVLDVAHARHRLGHPFVRDLPALSTTKRAKPLTTSTAGHGLGGRLHLGHGSCLGFTGRWRGGGRHIRCGHVLLHHLLLCRLPG